MGNVNSTSFGPYERLIGRLLQPGRYAVFHTDVSRGIIDCVRPRVRILSPPPSHEEIPGGLAISYLSPLLAVVLGIVHAALAPVIVVGGVKPNFVLIGVVLVTALGGFLPGVTWAFVAGLTANLLVGDPLGSMPLALLMVATLVAGGGRLFGRLIWIYPILAALVGSIVYDVITLAINQLVSDAGSAGLPFDLMLAAAVLNAGITALLLYPARLIAMRWVPDEVAAW
jgi:rod shape-determining protein MreD